MAIIGIVKKDGEAFEGRLQTLTLIAPIRIVPLTPAGEKAASYRIFSNGADTRHWAI